MKLSILIPSIITRDMSCAILTTHLAAQGKGLDITIHVNRDDGKMTIGAKRNKLLSEATGDYIVFIDDDDFISPYYIQHLMKGIESGVDCCSLRGVISWNQQKPEFFEHSLKYTEWKTNDLAQLEEIKYERNPNHLNCIKASIAKQFKFPETNFGEDHEWSKQLQKSGLLKTEYYINELLYYYNYITNK